VAAYFRCALVAVGVHLNPGMFHFAYAVMMICTMVPLVPADPSASGLEQW